MTSKEVTLAEKEQAIKDAEAERARRLTKTRAYFKWLSLPSALISQEIFHKIMGIDPRTGNADKEELPYWEGYPSTRHPKKLPRTESVLKKK